ncbi:hypothetical protein PAPYR_12172 [Paratrimastix pyriformis]|uniref:Uncharacterized protein n=1 Tax=Paratrimastix pyriformis TaxID=342808 RepID=A0ABQ8U7P6_9EUKA|nr:hypothetical protein PAPYR_12172 [Paratrimastix pyriformis]
MSTSSHSILASQLVLSDGSDSARITTTEGKSVAFPTGASATQLDVTGKATFYGDAEFKGNVVIGAAPTMPLKLTQLNDVSISPTDTTDQRLVRFDTATGKWVADVTYSDTPSASTLVRRTSNGEIKSSPDKID